MAASAGLVGVTRFSLEHRDLIRLVRIARHGMSSPDDMGPSGHARLTIRDGMATIGARDASSILTASSPAKAEGDLDLALPMRHLSAIARSVKQAVNFTLKDNDLLAASSGRMRFNIPTLPASTFGDIRRAGAGDEFVVNLPELLERALPAALVDGMVYAGLDGVALHSVDDRLRIIATNNVVLRVQSIPKPEGIERAWMVTIPRVVAKNIAKLIKGSTKVRVDERSVSVEAGDGSISITSSLLSPGVHPGYERAVVGRSEVQGKVDADDLLQAIEAVTPFLPRKRGGGYAEVMVENGVMTAAAIDGQGVAATTSIAIEMSGEVPNFSVRTEDLLPILRDLRSKNVVLHFHIKAGNCQVIWLEEEGFTDSRMIIAAALSGWPATIDRKEAA